MLLTIRRSTLLARAYSPPELLSCAADFPDQRGLQTAVLVASGGVRDVEL